MGSTSIEWTNKTWNPVRGCSRVSAGCDHCYAMGQAHRFDTGAGVTASGKLAHAGPYHGLTTIRRGKVDWSGVVRFVPEMLDRPLRWKRPRRIFVNSMSDLFHESLSNEQIAAVFGVMAAASQHTFQVLTKRPKRMREWFEWCARRGEQGKNLFPYDDDAWRIRQLLNVEARRVGCSSPKLQNHGGPWPLTNVCLGTSCEDQQRADERIPELLACPAAVHGVSLEPLLGPIDLSKHLGCSRTIHCALDVEGALRNRSFDGMTDGEGHALSREAAKRELERLLASGVRVIPMGDCEGFSDQTGCPGHRNPGINWVIAGGESGPGARPCDVEWIRAIVRQCKDAGVACFVKQLGAHYVDPENGIGGVQARPPTDLGITIRRLKHRKGGDPAEWPEDLRVREFPTEVSRG